MSSRIASPRPTAQQRHETLEVVRWYLKLYHGTDDDSGVAAMFCDPARVGAFAVSKAALAAGEPEALFRVLIAVTMFQRLADQLILKILRGIPAAVVDELTAPSTLVAQLVASGCPHGRSLEGLLTACDLTKDIASRGVCSREPGISCSLKQHTEVLKRYGHFGKVPTSLAFALQESGVPDLRALREQCLAEGAGSAAQAAELLESKLRRAWRVSDKVAAMFLSLVSNPELSPGLAPWSEGLDWRRWVVIDSNVDQFLKTLGYPGPWTYPARQQFLERLAEGIDLSELKPGLSSYNPRLVQQALYLFTSTTNRKALARDCAHAVPSECGGCVLRERCGVRRG